MSDRIDGLPTRADLQAMRVELNADIAQFVKGIEETNQVRHAETIKTIEANTRAQVAAILEKTSADDTKTADQVSAAIDDKYSDLPRRVAKLEQAVFPPKRQRRR